MSKKHQILHLLTEAGEALQKDPSTIPWNTYPRPQMKRDSFFCLNGEWTVEIDGEPSCSIRVPFCPESLLSGVRRESNHTECLIYHKTFILPEHFQRERVLLHFGAVDQIVQVNLNGHILGMRQSGYTPISFDITNHLRSENRLDVIVWDNLNAHIRPYGKQRADRGGMWYTPVSGIWQTVWLESVPDTYIHSLRIDTAEDRACGTATITAKGVTDGTVTVTTTEGEFSFPLIDGQATVTIPSPRLWSPDDPYLYEFTVKAGEDKVASYFALRTLEIKEVDGIPRLCLNGAPVFLHALLDQGYWSDGIYTPATPECYEQDILAMKELGFNTLRKHIKVEPEQFYYDCDRLGMLVMQDMVNNGHYSFLRDTALPTVGIKTLPDKNLHKDRRTRRAFMEGMEKTVAQLYNHPCVIYWTIFNEGWGQFDSQTAYEHLKTLDSTRFIDTASGWFKGADSDVDSEHIYFKPVKLKYSEKPMVLSEFGGYSYKPEGHVANTVGTYGYRFFKEQADFEAALIKLYETEIIPAVEKGLCGAVYTQVSDVEDETNGLLSYDRKVCKVGSEPMKRIAERLYASITSKK